MMPHRCYTFMAAACSCRCTYADHIYVYLGPSKAHVKMRTPTISASRHTCLPFFCSQCHRLLALITLQQPGMRQNMIFSGSQFLAPH